MRHTILQQSSICTTVSYQRLYFNISSRTYSRLDFQTWRLDDSIFLWIWCFPPYFLVEDSISIRYRIWYDLSLLSTLHIPILINDNMLWNRTFIWIWTTIHLLLFDHHMFLSLGWNTKSSLSNFLSPNLIFSLRTLHTWTDLFRCGDGRHKFSN